MILFAFFAGYFVAALVFALLLKRINRKWAELVEAHQRSIDGWQRLYDERTGSISTADDFIEDVLGPHRSRR